MDYLLLAKDVGKRGGDMAGSGWSSRFETDEPAGEWSNQAMRRTIGITAGGR
jgi:hypothetical protein